jgi:hypothetical protein
MYKIYNAGKNPLRSGGGGGEEEQDARSEVTGGLGPRRGSSTGHIWPSLQFKVGVNP